MLGDLKKPNESSYDTVSQGKKENGLFKTNDSFQNNTEISLIRTPPLRKKDEYLTDLGIFELSLKKLPQPGKNYVSKVLTTTQQLHQN